MTRILTTHVGSLARPAELLELRRAGTDNEAYLDGLRAAVDEVVAKQVEVGLDVINDGEMGKIGWIEYLFARIDGIEYHRGDPAAMIGKLLVSGDREQYPEFYAEHDAAFAAEVELFENVCTGPITYTGADILQRDIEDFKGALGRAGHHEGFLPVVAPASIEPLIRDEHYGDDEALVNALADVLRVEYKAIVDAGLIVQVDDAFLATEYDTIITKGGSESDYQRWAQIRVDALNRALEGLPPDRVRYHVCWGSWHGPHTSDAPLRVFVDLMLQVNAGAYLLEQGNVRHEHEWRVWEDVALPDGKILIPGVVSHTTTLIEHPELVAERLVRMAKLVGPEQLMAGTDCGFAQAATTRRVHPTIQWGKLEALVEGAALASKQLS